MKFHRKKLDPIPPKSRFYDQEEQYQPDNQLPPIGYFNNPREYDNEGEPFNSKSINQRDDQRETDLKPKVKPLSIIDHSQLVNNYDIRRCFPVSDRSLMRIARVMKFNCSRPFKSYVDYIGTIENEQEKAFEDESLNRKCAYINVMHSSNLELDPNVMHPFIKIHIVDMRTGNYIQKSMVRPAVAHYESITTFMKNEKTFDVNSCDIIIPFATKCNDLRESGNSRAIWNEVFYINEDANVIFQPNTVILIELLDFNKRLITEKRSDLMNPNLFYRVAWGYLRPLGVHRNHFGISRIQLYKYKFQHLKTSSLALKPEIPHIYYDFIWPYKKKYDGYVTIQVLAEERLPPSQTMYPPKTIFEIEKGEDFGKTLAKHHREEEQAVFEEEISEKDKILFKRRRLPEEPCQIPTKILYKFQTSKFGCLKIAISHNGKYLAAACTQENSKTIIKIFDLDDGTVPYIYKGHRNLIHDLDWSLNDKFLISSSSDYSAIVWKVPKNSDDVIDEEESEKTSLLCMFKHPSYVYGGKIMPEKMLERLIVATICFDGKVRIWLMEYNNRNNNELNRGDLMGESMISMFEDQYETYTNLLDHRHPNTLLFNENGRLYIGDSLGIVHIYDVKVKFKNILLTRIRTITHSEIDGDAINSIYFKPPENHVLIIHSRDNCIRAFEENETEEKVLARYFGSKSSKFPIKSGISPDGNFIISGSEDGKPYLWNYTNKEVQDSEVFQLSLMDSVSDVAWSNNFHVVACSGFGKEYPILVYFWEREGEINVKDFKYIMENIYKKEKEEFNFQENEKDQNFNYKTNDYFEGNQENPNGEGNIKREKNNQFHENKKIFKKREKS